MPHPLQQKVHLVGGRARRLVLLHAVSLMIVVATAAALLAGGADYLIRYHDRGVRIIASLLFLAAAGWSVWRFLLPAWRFRPSEVDTARRIERRFPQLRDRLSSSVSFLRESEDDPRAGSVALRRAVVSEIEGEVEPLDLREALDPRPARKALLAAAGVLAVATIVCVLDPASAALAGRRLAVPWSGEAWPLWNNLAFENPPRRLAKGANFEVELIDKNGRLPDEVQIQTWFADEEPSDVESAPMKLLGEKMIARRENVTRPFRYRAVGGDDRAMPWIELEVVEPPQAQALEIYLHPPAYTGWPVEKSGPNLRALQGTTVEVRGTAETPLKAARIAVDAVADLEIPLTLTENPRGFLLASGEPAWKIESSGAWRLLLTDATGVTGGSDVRHEIQAVPDRPPTVALDGDGAVSYVTAKAVVPLRGVVKDDLAIRAIDLRYLDSSHSDQDFQAIEIFRGPEKMVASLGGAAALNGEGAAQPLAYEWDLAKLGELAPGVQLTYHIAAGDYKPQEESSPARRLVVISERELEDRIGRRHSEILARLAEALDKQRSVRSQTTALEIQLDTAGALAPRDLDHLQSAELNQRQVQQMLAAGPEGVESQIASLLDDVRNNRLDNPDVQRRMDQLLTAVRSLAETHLPAVQSGLIDALKEAQAGKTAPSEDDEEAPAPEPATPPKSPQETTPQNQAARASLRTAGEHQDAVIDSLDKMLGELSQWDNYRRVARDIHQLHRDQDGLAARTEETGAATLGKAEKDLTPQERAGLKRLAQQQDEIARRFEETQTRMRAMASDLEATEPLAAETLADALDAAQRSGLSSKMRESGANLGANRLGQAAQEQKGAAADLEEMLNVLSNRRENELARQIEKLRAAAADLEQRQNELKELRKKQQQAGKQADPAEQKRQLDRLAQEQAKLAKEVKRLARRLERLQAERAGQSAAQGAESLNAAGQQSEQGNADEAEESAEQAEQDLENAQQQLKQAIAKAEQDLFFEQMVRFEQTLRGMIQRQQAVVVELTRLAEIQRQGELSRGQLASVTSLGDVQRALADEAEQVAVKIAQAKAFEFGLRSAVREMNLTAARLARRELGDQVEQSARAALDRLERLAEALKSDAGEKPPGQKPEGQAGQSGGEQKPPSDGIAMLAELKLLKLMQEELNGRTIALEEARQAGGQLTAEQDQQLAELSAEQGRLAELLINLGAANAPDPADASDPPADNPEGEPQKSLEQSLLDDLQLQE